jgi:hypothetical protein
MSAPCLDHPRYLGRCVEWPLSDVAALVDMIDRAEKVGLVTLRKRIGPSLLGMFAASQGYVRKVADGLVLAGDPYVTYHRSVLHGETVYFVRHSAIEYIFRPRAVHKRKRFRVQPGAQ